MSNPWEEQARLKKAFRVADEIWEANRTLEATASELEELWQQPDAQAWMARRIGRPISAATWQKVFSIHRQKEQVQREQQAGHPVVRHLKVVSS